MKLLETIKQGQTAFKQGEEAAARYIKGYETVSNRYPIGSDCFKMWQTGYRNFMEEYANAYKNK